MLRHGTVFKGRTFSTACRRCRRSWSTIMSRSCSDKMDVSVATCVQPGLSDVIGNTVPKCSIFEIWWCWTEIEIGYLDVESGGDKLVLKHKNQYNGSYSNMYVAIVRVSIFVSFISFKRHPGGSRTNVVIEKALNYTIHNYWNIL